MKNLRLDIAAIVALSFLSSGLARAESAWDDAFPVLESPNRGAQAAQTAVGAAELGAGVVAGLEGRVVADKLKMEEILFDRFRQQARAEVAKEHPHLQPYAEKEARFEHLETLRQSKLLKESDRAEHAALKKFMSDEHDRFESLFYLTKEKQAALLEADALKSAARGRVAAEVRHNHEMRTMKAGKLGAFGLAAALVADSALRVVSTLTGRDAGYVPAAGMIQSLGARPKAEPKAKAAEPVGASTLMSVE